MTALVVYESMYGNTAAVAMAIADGIGEVAAAVEVGAAPMVLPAGIDLLVVGGPTHARGMSQETSRRDAGARADRPVVSKAIGIREWIERVQLTRSIEVAVFDTRVPGPAILWGSAAKAAGKALKQRGARLVVAPESFVLDGISGPRYDRMPPAELERAREWGRGFAGLLPIVDT